MRILIGWRLGGVLLGELNIHDGDLVEGKKLRRIPRGSWSMLSHVQRT
jgi:hypothetical protein